jgi:hypothetical protein
MGYTTEDKQDTVVESVLLTTEKVFIPTKVGDYSDTSKTSEVVYFEIED